MRVEGGLEAAHEGEVGARRSPDVDGALESSWAPRERSGGVFGSADRKDASGGFRKALGGSGVFGIGQESEVEDAAGASEDCMRERSLVRE